MRTNAPMVTLEGWDGLPVHVPESRLEEAAKEQAELRRQYEAGEWVPYEETPECKARMAEWGKRLREENAKLNLPRVPNPMDGDLPF